MSYTVGISKKGISVTFFMDIVKNLFQTIFSCNSGNVLKIQKYEQNRFLCRIIAFSSCLESSKIHDTITTFLPE